MPIFCGYRFTIWVAERGMVLIKSIQQGKKTWERMETVFTDIQLALDCAKSLLDDGNEVLLIKTQGMNLRYGFYGVYYEVGV